MSEDCTWTFPGEWSRSRSWGAKSAVVGGLLRPLMAQFASDYRMVADLILGDADRVVVQVYGRGTTVDGTAYPQTYCFIFRIADGRIAEVVEHCGTALVEQVLHPLPAARPPRLVSGRWNRAEPKVNSTSSTNTCPDRSRYSADAGLRPWDAGAGRPRVAARRGAGRISATVVG
ncbi:nuclear transport factor 2 family protein [Nocardia sp. NPDC088792]|uniref:nuclear transport factor 2 family protein n=1 Tax=Nocardia sp. NPDC088792 TaxID=3364332 RepID=UPI003825ECE2